MVASYANALWARHAFLPPRKRGEHISLRQAYVTMVVPRIYTTNKAGQLIVFAQCSILNRDTPDVDEAYISYAEN